MKEKLFTIILMLAFLGVKGQIALDQTYVDNQNGLAINYPSSWKIDTKVTKSYAIKLADAENTAFLYVKRTDFGEKISAKDIITKFIEPAWVKVGATVINQPESVRAMTPEQLAMKQAESGYSVLMRQPVDGGINYIGYVILTKGNLVYEVKYEGSNITPPDIVKVLPRIGLSLKLL